MIPISRPQIDRQEIEAVSQVLKSGRLAQGPQVAEFEERFADYVGARYGVACGNGTQALMLALLAHGIGPGDEVITTPFTFVATASAVMMCGAKPVFVDVEEKTGNLDPAQIKAALSKPRLGCSKVAILPVHLYGHPVRMAQIAQVVYEEMPDAPIIWDACQAHGALNPDNTGMGAWHTSCFSFYATKNIATGEGGMVTTNDGFDTEGIADRLRSLRNHGQGERYHYKHLGYNFRMTEIQAAIGLVQLEKLPEMQAKRHQNATYLTENLEGVITPVVRPGCVHAWHQYTVRVPGGRDRRDALQAHLTGRGIGSSVYYPLPLHLQPAFAHLGYRLGDFPIAEKLSGEVLSLPVHPGLSSEDLERIIEGVNGWQD